MDYSYWCLNFDENVLERVNIGSIHLKLKSFADHDDARAEIENEIVNLKPFLFWTNHNFEYILELKLESIVCKFVILNMVSFSLKMQ